jgi:hypothetical protein
MDRVKTRKDPLLQQDVYEYEPGDNVKKVTDRRGLVTPSGTTSSAARP